MGILKHRGILILVIINLVSIFYCSLDKGRGAFLAIPIILLTNLTVGIYSLVKKDEKLMITSIISFFAAPFLGFMVFIFNFPFLTR